MPWHAWKGSPHCPPPCKAEPGRLLHPKFPTTPIWITFGLIGNILVGFPQSCMEVTWRAPMGPQTLPAPSTPMELEHLQRGNKHFLHQKPHFSPKSHGRTCWMWERCGTALRGGGTKCEAHHLQHLPSTLLLFPMANNPLVEGSDSSWVLSPDSVAQFSCRMWLWFGNASYGFPGTWDVLGWALGFASRRSCSKPNYEVSAAS